MAALTTGTIAPDFSLQSTPDQRLSLAELRVGRSCWFSIRDKPMSGMTGEAALLLTGVRDPPHAAPYHQPNWNLQRTANCNCDCTCAAASPRAIRGGKLLVTRNHSATNCQ
jgi:hypothetical protein